MIPNRLPQIPDHMIAYVGGWNKYPYTYYALWKDGHLLVVQVKCLARNDVDYYKGNPRAEEELLQEYFNVLETIESVIDTIQFEQTNWAYLTPGNGCYRLQQRRKVLPTITVPLWAPMIYEHEIKWKRFIECRYRIGEWNGREVDVFRAWDYDSLQCLDRMMANYRELEGLDVTFPVLGHLLDSNGTVVGLVTEPAVGREVTSADRLLVYDFVAKLQRLGYLFDGIYDNNMVISEGKVRIILMMNRILKYYPPEKRDELEKVAAKEHWGYLGRLFSGEHYSLWPAYRRARAIFTFLTKIPYPEKPFHQQGEYRTRRQYRHAVIKTNVENALSIASRASLRARERHNCTLDNSDEAFLPERHLHEQRFNPYCQISRRLILPPDHNSDATSNSSE